MAISQFTNACTVYMHGGNILEGFYEEIDANHIDIYVMNDESHNGPGSHTSAHYRIALDHIDKIEFTGPREDKGFEFIGLER